MQRSSSTQQQKICRLHSS